MNGSLPDVLGPGRGPLSAGWLCHVIRSGVDCRMDRPNWGCASGPRTGHCCRPHCPDPRGVQAGRSARRRARSEREQRCGSANLRARRFPSQGSSPRVREAPPRLVSQPVVDVQISVDEQRDSCTHKRVVELERRVRILKRFAVAHFEVVLRLVPQCLVMLSDFTCGAMTQPFDDAPVGGFTCRVMFPMNRDRVKRPRVIPALAVVSEARISYGHPLTPLSLFSAGRSLSSLSSSIVQPSTRRPTHPADACAGRVIETSSRRSTQLEPHCAKQSLTV